MAAALVAGAAAVATVVNVGAKYTFLYPHGTWSRLVSSRVVQRLVDNRRRDALRAAAEAKRVKEGRNHVLVVYYAPDDAHSHVLLHALCRFLQHYRVELHFRVIDGGCGHSTSDAEQRAWQRRDAALLADLYGYPLPGGAEGADLDADAIMLVARATLAAQGSLLKDATSAADQQAFLQKAVELGAALFAGQRPPMGEVGTLAEAVSVEEAERLLRQNTEALSRAGHYLSGMMEYEGEFYWGIDRLRHLEERLQSLPGTARGAPVQQVLFNKTFELRFLGEAAPQVSGTPTHPLELFYSPRSPYSQLAVDRCIKMAAFYGVELRIRPVFPMVMRKLSVPQTKKFYIIRDTKRESDVWGFPFAKVGFKDPLWEPTYRFMAVWPYAEQETKTKEFTRAFAHGVYCDGVDFGTDRGVKRIVERAGLDYAACLERIREAEAWATVDRNGDDSRLSSEPAKSNIHVMMDAGLWGVPCLRYGDLFVWGADRLWAIEAAIQRDPGLSIQARSKM